MDCLRSSKKYRRKRGGTPGLEDADLDEAAIDGDERSAVGAVSLRGAFRTGFSIGHCMLTLLDAHCLDQCQLFFFLRSLIEPAADVGLALVDRAPVGPQRLEVCQGRFAIGPLRVEEIEEALAAAPVGVLDGIARVLS